MEAGCWLLGGEFEDSVFEERRERRPGPPASYRAKLCEPQVRGRGLFSTSRPPVLAWAPGPTASPVAPVPTGPPVISNHREGRRAQGNPRAVAMNWPQAFGGSRCDVLVSPTQLSTLRTPTGHACTDCSRASAPPQIQPPPTAQTLAWSAPRRACPRSAMSPSLPA